MCQIKLQKHNSSVQKTKKRFSFLLISSGETPYAKFPSKLNGALQFPLHISVVSITLLKKAFRKFSATRVQKGRRVKL
jgi:hypothetical protein